MHEVSLKIARELRKRLKSPPIDNRPKGTPAASDNTDDCLDGTYKQENLIDPGIRNMVTGSGAGPIIGGHGRGHTVGFEGA